MPRTRCSRASTSTLVSAARLGLGRVGVGGLLTSLSRRGGGRASLASGRRRVVLGALVLGWLGLRGVRLGRLRWLARLVGLLSLVGAGLGAGLVGLSLVGAGLVGLSLVGLGLVRPGLV